MNESRNTRWLTRLVAAAFLLAPAAAPAAKAIGDELAAGWQLVRSGEDPEQDCTVYSRPRSGSRYSEYRMEFAIDASPSAVLAALSHNLLDPNTYPNGMERKILRRAGDTIVFYDYIAVPFLSDRDVVMRLETQRDPAKGSFTLVWRAVDDEGPEQREGVVRMPSSDGFWALHPREGGGTSVVHESHVELGGSLPASFAELRVPAELAQQATELRRTAEAQKLAQR